MEALREHCVKLGLLSLGVFDPDPDNSVVVYVGKCYADTPANRSSLQRSIDKFNRMAERDGLVGVCMGVFRQ